jgi:hypothetical protein
LIGAFDANRCDDAAVVRDVTREAASIREGEQIGLASIAQIAEGSVCYGALRHNCSEGFLDKINRISKLPKMVGLWLSFPASAGEGEFSDAGFVEVTESFRNHAVKLVLGGFGEREMEAFFMGEGERDAAVLRGVGTGEEAGVVTVLHVLAIGFQNL